MTDYILDINTVPDCEKLKSYHIDALGYELDYRYLNPGYVWIYFSISVTNYIGEIFDYIYFFPAYLLDNIVNKNSYVVLVPEIYSGHIDYYADIYTSMGDLVYRQYITTVLSDTVVSSYFDYMICGCGDNAILCGKCCIYCCKIAETTKEYYEKILE